MKYLPYWRLSSFYFFYFALLGALIPYWSLFLRDRGFDAVAIGGLMAIFMGTKILAPMLWGWYADHTGERLRIIRIGAVLTFFSFIGIFFSQSFGSVAITMMFFSFFWYAVLPQIEVITLARLGHQKDRYSQIRLWGSIGFIAAVASAGLLFEWLSIAYLPWFLLGIMGLIAISAFWIPEAQFADEEPDSTPFRALLKENWIKVLLWVCFLMQLSHGAYYTFFSIYLEQAGYSRAIIGVFWSLGVLAEIFVFIAMPRILRVLNPSRLMAVSLLLAAFRWLLTAYYVDDVWILAAAQTLHAATYGCFHAAAITLVQNHFGDSHAGKGQALYGSISFGAGGAVGALVAGAMWQEGATILFLFSSGIALLAFLSWCIFAFFDRQKHQLEPAH